MMKAKDAEKVTKMASKALSKHNTLHTNPTSPRMDPNHGRQIFVYNHLQTNQVVYSLTRSLKNNYALRQLPYNGKKTVPAALRKDLWAPMACINFTELESTDPSLVNLYGRKTFQKLREFRKLHETQWPKSFALDPKTNRPLSRIERGRRLCDQKANSVADIAAALSAVTLRKEVKQVEVEVEREGEGGEKIVEKELREEKVFEPLVKATVQWKDILDAEFAGYWPKTVVHDQWITTFNNRKAPIMRTELREVEIVGEPVPEPVQNEAGKVEL